MCEGGKSSKEGGTYRSHEHAEHAAQPKAHDARHDRFCVARLHQALHLAHICRLFTTVSLGRLLFVAAMEGVLRKLAGLARLTILTLGSFGSPAPAPDMPGSGEPPPAPGKLIVCSDSSDFPVEERVWKADADFQARGKSM